MIAPTVPRTHPEATDSAPVAVRDTSRVTWMVVGNVGLLLVGFGLQLLVYGRGGHSSLSDLPHVFLHRGISAGAPPYLDRMLEYPVGAGMLLYLAALIRPTPLGVLTVTALAAGGLSVWITVALERRVGGRAWRWALGTPVLLFAFQNWDVFAIATLLGALLLFERGRDGGAGALLGVGTAVKLFPVVLVPVLAAARWAEGDRRGARRLVGAAAGTWLALNLPLLVANPHGWWWPNAFQARRVATWGSVWYYLDRWLGLTVTGAAGARVANVMAMLLLLTGIAALTWWTAKGRIAPVPAAAVAVAWFVLSNKVYSPTYDIWLVLFFVMLPLSRRLWLAYCAVDLAVYVVVFGMFHGLWGHDVVHAVLPALVLVRTGAILTVVACALGGTRRPAPFVAPVLTLRRRPAAVAAGASRHGTEPW